MPADLPLFTGEGPRRMNPNMIFAPDRSAIYVSVPKTGCTSLKMLLAARAGLIDPNLLRGRTRGWIHEMWRDRQPRWSDLTPAERREILEGPGAFRFTSVRNPFERVVSCYLNKLIVHADDFYLAAKIRARGEVTLLSFLRFAADEDPLKRDIHYRVMSDMIFPKDIGYDEIIRYESFDADARRVMAKLGAADLAIPSPAPLNETRAGSRMHALLGPRECDLIREIYRADFEAFGYSLDLPPAGPEARRPD